MYPIGFEQVVKLAIDNFKKMGLDVTMMRTSHSIFTKRGTSVGGYYSESPNKQYEYDHREDEALFMDKKFVSRRLEVQKEAYEQKEGAFRCACGACPDRGIRGNTVYPCFAERGMSAQ